jgi:hypothetical protein
VKEIFLCLLKLERKYKIMEIKHEKRINPLVFAGVGILLAAALVMILSPIEAHAAVELKNPSDFLGDLSSTLKSYILPIAVICEIILIVALVAAFFMGAITQDERKMATISQWKKRIIIGIIAIAIIPGIMALVLGVADLVVGSDSTLDIGGEVNWNPSDKPS